MTACRFLLHLVALAGVLTCAGGAVGQEAVWSGTELPAEEAPRFDDYPAPWPGWPRHEPVAKVDLESDPRAWQFAGLLESAVGKGRNFAANYRLVEIGCGSGCATIATVNADTGDVVIGPVAVAGVDYSAVSTLLVVNPLDRLRQLYGFRIPVSIYPHYYHFTESGFERIWCWHPGAAEVADHPCAADNSVDVSGAVSPTTAPTGVSLPDGKPFGDWQTYCDADRNCTAETYQREGAQSENLLLLERSAEQPDWTIALLTSAPLAARPPDLGVAVDGDPELAFHESDIWMTDISADGRLYTTEIQLLGNKAQALLDQLPPGASVSMAFTDADGVAQLSRFSLFSVTEALAWIDRQQQREGQPHTAGGAMETLVAEVEFAAEDPPLVLELHGANDDCDLPADLQHGGDMITRTELGDGTTIYIVPCAGGGYNLAYLAYRDTGGEISQLQFVDYSEEESWFSTPYLFNPEWNAETGTLTSFKKGRSLGDCGSIGEWRYGDMGLRLERFFYQRACDGSVPPGQLPLFFAAKAAPVCAPGERCD